MKYDIHFRYGGKITIESRRTLDEMSDVFRSNGEGQRSWVTFSDGDDPSALVFLMDIIAILPTPPLPATPSGVVTSGEERMVIDSRGGVWREETPGSGFYRLDKSEGFVPLTRDEIGRTYGLSSS